MNKTVKSLTALAGLISIVFAIYFFADKTYAKDVKVCLLEQRLDLKIADDSLKASEQRLWRYEDRFGVNAEKAPDPIIRQEMKELKSQIERQKEYLRKFNVKP